MSLLPPERKQPCESLYLAPSQDGEDWEVSNYPGCERLLEWLVTQGLVERGPARCMYRPVGHLVTLGMIFAIGADRLERLWRERRPGAPPPTEFALDDWARVLVTALRQTDEELEAAWALLLLARD